MVSNTKHEKQVEEPGPGASQASRYWNLCSRRFIFRSGKRLVIVTDLEMMEHLLGEQMLGERAGFQVHTVYELETRRD